MDQPLYELTGPHEHGLLDVGDGNRIYWETLGNPDGKPVLNVHGGPGGGGRRSRTSGLNPEDFRIIRFDQRNCGDSLPHASDPSVSLEHNTTDHLIADMEHLREHLGVERWLLFGGSWGSALILAYAQRHPERVSEIVIVSSFLGRQEDIDWLYNGLRPLLPGAWEAFRDALPAADRDGDLVAAYNRLLNSPDSDQAVRLQAARDWCAWEDAVIAHEALGHPGAYSNRPDDALLALVRICAHYFANNAWLEDGQLIRDAHRLAGIPGVMVQGRLDLGCPLKGPWDLARVWPDAELKVIDEAGHTGSPTMRQTVLDALARFGKNGR
ncbi:prolyl aminopeptidase [Kitasatospora acidiphila]|uniref:Proline iminopeptidase n=1 Tax=Kitasatospora acidiphila TaxID=2567942 RepID=A0A540WBC6_9ACTN|nr:prolyl aminopeptidase [Kitasatospora acidiphila]TQF06262.1 prolyl aminopeptidase [Kitasatospora acidiphila]